MEETILNLYLVINDGTIDEFRAVSYNQEGSDDEKITFLKSKAANDFASAKIFSPPENKHGKRMTYRQFSKLEKAGKQFDLFEGVFQYYRVPDNPLVCLTPVVDGKLIENK